MLHLLLSTLLTIGTAVATYCPSRSARRYHYPSKLPNCACEQAQDSSLEIIQLAECSKNTRVKHAPQFFALFIAVEDSDENTHHGGPHGLCLAFACEVPADAQWISHPRAVSLFWDTDTGGEMQKIDASNCIKSPKAPYTCGCEVSGSGQFLKGVDSCQPEKYNGDPRYGKYFPCGKPTKRKCGFELDGVGIGTWNVDLTGDDHTPPGDPVNECWRGYDFGRDQQPAGTWDKYICVPDFKTLQQEDLLLQQQNPAAFGNQLQAVDNGATPPLGMPNNNQLYNLQNIGNVDRGSVPDSLLSAAGGSNNPLVQSLAADSSGKSHGPYTQGKTCGINDPLEILTCSHCAKYEQVSGLAASLLSLNPPTQPVAVGANMLQNDASNSNMDQPQGLVGVGGGSVLRNVLGTSLAGGGGGNGNGNVRQYCPGSQYGPGSAASLFGTGQNQPVNLAAQPGSFIPAVELNQVQNPGVNPLLGALSNQGNRGT